MCTSANEISHPPSRASRTNKHTPTIMEFSAMLKSHRALFQQLVTNSTAVELCNMGTSPILCVVTTSDSCVKIFFYPLSMTIKVVFKNFIPFDFLSFRHALFGKSVNFFENFRSPSMCKKLSLDNNSLLQFIQIFYLYIEKNDKME